VNDLVESSRLIIERGSKSFAAAARLFDPQTRASAYLLYAWCRHCDDVTDGQDLGWGASEVPEAAARSSLDSLRRQTEAALAGEPMENPLFAGLQQVVVRHEIPHRYPLEHLRGFAMDVTRHRYTTLEDTISYCYYVAGVVGVMMAYIMGVRDPDALDRATDLGLAFQLTNIARDIVEDARVGRVYLPATWLEEVHVDPADVAVPQHREAIFVLAERLLDEAEQYYRSSVVGLASLPFRSAWAVATAKEVYRGIGGVVRRRGPAAWDSRASTSKSRKLMLAVKGLGSATASRLAPTSVPRDGLWTRPESAAG
jgi:phytoene synthase